MPEGGKRGWEQSTGPVSFVPMTVAFVFSGGASLGSIQAGMLQSLEEAGVVPDMVIGTSVGAINGAWVAGGGTAAELIDIWLGLRREDMFPFRPIHGLQAFLGRSPHFVPPDGLRRVLRRHVAFDRLEDAALLFAVLATDAQTGDEVMLQTGPAVDAILASSALPGIFPPVTLEGKSLIDGGIVNNTPITTAINAGATEVWVLSTGYSCALSSPPAHPLALALHSIGLLVQQRLVLETQDREYPVPVHLIPPPCPIDVSPMDFSHGQELIERAFIGTTRWLGNGRPFAIPMTAGHRH